jgi:hypothetical protein
MRAAFLGEILVADQAEAQATRGGDSSFHADLNVFTKEKQLAAKAAALKALNNSEAGKAVPAAQPAGFNPDGTGAFGSSKPSRSPNQWDDSFIQSDETRPAKLS